MTANALSGLRILVVEDEPLIAYDIALTLEEAGAIVVGPAPSLARALEIISCEEIDLGVLDVRLSDDNVGPAAAALAAKGTSFVFHTGHADPDVTSRWPSSPVVRKPSPPEALVMALLSLQPAPDQGS